jgi:hypothetical protein
MFLLFLLSFLVSAEKTCVSSSQISLFLNGTVDFTELGLPITSSNDPYLYCATDAEIDDKINEIYENMLTIENCNKPRLQKRGIFGGRRKATECSMCYNIMLFEDPSRDKFKCTHTNHFCSKCLDVLDFTDANCPLCHAPQITTLSKLNRKHFKQPSPFRFNPRIKILVGVVLFWLARSKTAIHPVSTDLSKGKLAIHLTS